LGVDSGRSPHYYFSMRPRTLDVDRGIDTSCRYSRDHRRENGKTMIPRNRYADQRGGFMSSLGDLATLLGTPRVATARLANFDPAFRVTIDVQRFDSIPGQELPVEAVMDTSFDALAAEHGRALATVSGDITAASRREAAARS
jgi:hypothetical protein